MTAIYQHIKRIAKPVVKHYHDDLTVYDRRTCDTLTTGCTAFWMPREHGTHWTWHRCPVDAVDDDTLESLRNRLNHMDAVVSVFGNAQWYLIESTSGRHGTVTAVETGKARQIMVDRIKAVEHKLYPNRRQAA